MLRCSVLWKLRLLASSECISLRVALHHCCNIGWTHDAFLGNLTLVQSRLSAQKQGCWSRSRFLTSRETVRLASCAVEGSQHRCLLGPTNISCSWARIAIIFRPQTWMLSCMLSQHERSSLKSCHPASQDSGVARLTAIYTN